MDIQIKRIYAPYDRDDGFRVLVDRLWPRGIKKEDAHIDIWLKEIGPSPDLRKWFDHDRSRWTAFLKKYKAELKLSDVFDSLKELAKSHKKVTLLYASKEEQYNQAGALLEFLKK